MTEKRLMKAAMMSPSNESRKYIGENISDSNIYQKPDNRDAQCNGSNGYKQLLIYYDKDCLNIIYRDAEDKVHCQKFFTAANIFKRPSTATEYHAIVIN